MDRLGIGHAQLKVLMQDGYYITFATADKYAIRLRSHPSIIWSNWFSLEPEEGSKPADAPHSDPSRKKKV